MAKPGKINDLKIEFVSLVSAGANRRTLIAKAAIDKRSPFQARIIKSSTELREVWCAVYAPDEVDTHGNWADAATIRKAAHDYLENMGKVDREHDWQASENKPCQSFVVDKSMGMGFLNADGAEEPDGTWVICIKVHNDADWEAIKKGDVNGVSMGGWGTVDTQADPPKPVSVAKASLAENVKRREWQQLGYALTDTIDSILWDSTITDKAAAIQEAVAELGTLVTKSKENPMSSFISRLIAKASGWKGPEDVVASFAAEAEKITKGATPTEAALLEEYGAHAKALEAFDKGADSKPALDVELAKAKAALPAPTDQAAILKGLLQPLTDQLAALAGRVEVMEKAAPAPARQDQNGAPADDKKNPWVS